MTGRRSLVVLQWVGVLVAPLAWFGQHVIGQAVGQARCSVAQSDWGMSSNDWQIGLMVGAGLLIVASEIAAILVYRGTREGHYEDPPPIGRFQMFAIASMATNFLFLCIVLLDGIASILLFSCRNS